MLVIENDFVVSERRSIWNVETIVSNLTLTKSHAINSPSCYIYIIAWISFISYSNKAKKKKKTLVNGCKFEHSREWMFRDFSLLLSWFFISFEIDESSIAIYCLSYDNALVFIYIRLNFECSSDFLSLSFTLKCRRLRLRKFLNCWFLHRNLHDFVSRNLKKKLASSKPALQFENGPYCILFMKF